MRTLTLNVEPRHTAPPWLRFSTGGLVEICRTQAVLFQRVFPSGVTITDDQARNFPLVVQALDAGLQVCWLIRELDFDGWVRGPTNLWSGTPAGSRRVELCYDTPFESSGAEFQIAGYLAEAVAVHTRSGLLLTKRRL